MSQISEKYRRDFKNCEYENPRIKKVRLFQKKRVLKIIVIGIAIVILLIFYAIFYSPIFFVNNIEIAGLSKEKSESVNRIIYENMKGKSGYLFSKAQMFFFSTKKLKEELTNKFLFEDLQIRKKWPDTIKIVVKEKQGALIWRNNENCFIIDLIGVAFAKCQDELNYLTIKELNDFKKFELGQKVIDSEKIYQILIMAESLRNLFGTESAKIIEKQNDYLNIYLHNGPELKLALTFDVFETIAKVTAIYNNEKYRNDWSKLITVDLRFGEKIYIK